MTLDEAETRLSQELAYLNVAEHAGNAISIALAQSHVRYWESIVRTLRLEEMGGWRP